MNVMIREQIGRPLGDASCKERRRIARDGILGGRNFGMNRGSLQGKRAPVWATRLVVPHLRANQGRVGDAVREVVEALALAVDVGRGAVQAAAEGVGAGDIA